MTIKPEVKEKALFYWKVIIYSLFISLLIYFLVSTNIVQVFQIDTSYQIVIKHVGFIQFGY